MSSNKKRKKRGVTRRVKDSSGNIVVKRYKRKGSRFAIPGLKWIHLPQIIIGSLLMGYGTLTYYHKKGSFKETSNVWGQSVQIIFDNYPEFLALFLTGTIATAVGIFIGYAIFSKGIKINKWAGAFRQLIIIFAVIMLFSALFSPFLNEPGKIRQLDDDEYITVTDSFDLSGLDSPFYSEFLDGLLDLLGNIPDPSLVVANITSSDGLPITDNDRYLWRWEVAETYGVEENDLKKGYPDVQMDYIDSAFDSNLGPDVMRSFRVSEQMLTLTTSYSGSMLTPWNSRFGAQVAQLSNMTYSPIPDMNVYNDATTGYRDINEQPGVNIFLADSGASGSYEFNTFWSAEDKEGITTKSIKYDDLQTVLDTSPASRFGAYNSFDGISTIWGEKSLPGGSKDVYMADADATGFVTNYNKILGTIVAGETTVYDIAFQIYNQISSRLISDLLLNNIDITATGATSQSGEMDKGYFYYDAIENGQSYGIKDLLNAFVFMLRAFNIPARLVLGYSVGNIQDNQITMTLGNLHSWIEVLMPWNDGTDTQYSWGVFNPIPDPFVYLASGEFEYGKNSLGGQSNVTLNFTSGQKTDLFSNQEIAGLNSFQSFEFNEDVDGTISVSFDDLPAPNQQVNLYLLNESVLINGKVPIGVGGGISSISYPLGSVTTADDGTAQFKLNVARSGVITRSYQNGTIANITQNNNLLIKGLDPFASPGENNVYVLLAQFGLSFTPALVGWTVNSGITLRVNVPVTPIPNGAETVEAGAVIVREQFIVTVKINDLTTSDASVGEDTIDFLVMDSATFSALQTDLESGIFDAAALAQYTNATFPATNSSGESDLTYNFNFDDTEGDIYAIVALLRGTQVFSNMFMYLSNEVTMTLNTLDTLGLVDDKIISSANVTFTLDIQLDELDGPISTLFGLSTRGAENISLSYYVLEKDKYDAEVSGQDWNAFLTATSSCSDSPAIDVCFYFNPNNKNPYFSESGGDITDVDGFTKATFTLNNLAFPVNDYVIIVVNNYYQLFGATKRFLILSPPAVPLSIDYNNPVSIDQSLYSAVQSELVIIKNEYIIIELIYRYSVILYAIFLLLRRYTK